jgi:hypothetical protein
MSADLRALAVLGWWLISVVILSRHQNGEELRKEHTIILSLLLF